LAVLLWLTAYIRRISAYVASLPGYLDEFFHVYSSEQANQSALSLSDVEDMYKVTYVPCKVFIAHLPAGELEFKRTDKLYIANFNQVLAPTVHQVCATVKENESVYMHAEIKKAKEAYELLKWVSLPR
jgi:hypothetical protein